MFVSVYSVNYSQDLYYNCEPITEQTYSVGQNPNVYFDWNISGGGTITSGFGTNQITVQWNEIVGSYNISVYAIENGCFGEISTYSVSIEECTEASIFIPNAFSPNGDSFNEYFKVAIDGAINYKLTIWNRWGQLVFESNDPLIGWDGNYNGGKSQQDVYTYRVLFSDSYGEQSQFGFVTLIR